MSNYIQGVVDYIPQIQPYKPNLNFYQQVLDTKHAQYKEGYSKLSSLYGNLLDSPMLRTENIELRNKFFNDIGTEISKISGMDLSLSQNVDAAYKVFQPLIDNNYILKDMAYTKKAYKELEKAEDFRNCIDEKKCGGKYWEGGVRAIQYQMMDFQKSTAEESMKHEAPRFTPYVNVGEKAMKFAKDMGFNVSSVSWSPDGRYQITTKNGVQMIPSLTNAFLATFQNDQPALDYYQTSAFLQRKDYIAQNAGQYGSELEAERVYLNEMANQLFKKDSIAYAAAQEEAQSAALTKRVIGSIAKDAGLDPNDPTDKKLLATAQQSTVDELIALAASDHYKENVNHTDPATLVGSDMMNERLRVDFAVSRNMFGNDLYNAAAAYATLTGEQEVKADPYSIAGFEHSLAVSRIGLEYQYKWDFEKKKAGLDILTQQMKEKNQNNPYGQSGLNEYNSWTPGALGGANSGVIENILEDDNKVFVESGSGVTTAVATKAQAINLKLNNILSLENGAVVGNGVIVTDDLKQKVKAYQAQLFGQSKTTTTNVTEEKSGFLGSALGGSALATGVIGAGSALSGGLLGAGLAAAFSSDPKTTQKTETKGGYLREDGSLIEFGSNLEFTDGKSKNNWFYLNQRLDAAYNGDALFKKIVGDDPGIRQASANANQAYNIYKASETQLKNNTNVVQKAVASSGSLTTVASGAAAPYYAKQQLENNFVKNGVVVPKEEFVANYIKNHPNEVQVDLSTMDPNRSKAGQYMSMLGDMLSEYTPFAGNGSRLSQDEIASNAEKVYDEYAKTFSETYNQAKTATVPIKGYSSLRFGHVVGQDGGAGVQANPISIKVDSAFPGDAGATDYVSFMNNLENVLANPEAASGVTILNTNGANITSKFFEDAKADTSGAGIATLRQLVNDIKSGKKVTDDGRAMFTMTVHPLIANDPNKVGFTIGVNNKFMIDNSGTKNKAGLTTGLSDNNITVVMNKDLVSPDNNAYQQTQRTMADVLMDAYGQLNIDEYADFGGTAKIVPNKSGRGYIVSTGLKYYDAEGKLQTYNSVNLSHPEATPGMIANTIYQTFQQTWEQNKNANDTLRQFNPDLIRNIE